MCLIIFFFLLSCKQSVDTNVGSEIKDSISISIKLPKEEILILNLFDSNYNQVRIKFDNPTKNDSIINYKINRSHNYQVYFFHHTRFTNKFSISNFYYLVSPHSSSLKFELLNNQLKSKNKQAISVNELVETYKQISMKTSNISKKDKGLVLSDLDEIFKKNVIKYNDLKIKEFNKILYLDCMQNLNPNSVKINEFIQNHNLNSIVSQFNIFIMYKYIRDNYDNINYKQLNLNNYNPFYLDFLSKQIFVFLRYNENKWNKDYQKLKIWFFSTAFYKTNKAQIDKELKVLDRNKFKEFIQYLSIIDCHYKESFFKDIISSSTKKYFLIDFWATWCPPCIGGINKIRQMKLPAQVEVINLSVDELKDKVKWKKKSSDLIKGRSYLLDSNSKINKEFLKLIELKSIPRYILIDRKMNLIDEAFPHPQESQFLKGLSKLCSK